MRMNIKLFDLLVMAGIFGARDKVDVLSYGIWICGAIYFLCRIGDWREKND